MCRIERTSWLRSALFLILLGSGPVAAVERPDPAPPPPTAAEEPALEVAPQPSPIDPPAEPPAPAPLAAGQAVTLRVLQVVPADGLSPGERLLNGLHDLQVGDRFVAEILDPPCTSPPLIGGKVLKIVRPGWFGRPGYVAVEIVQFVEAAEGAPATPWRVDLRDRRSTAGARRALITALLAMEGGEVGAAIGAQVAGGHAAWVTGGMGVGAVLGLAYSSLQRGAEASLEPGDTFQIVVGTTSYRPVPRDWQTILYPAPDPNDAKSKGK